MIKKPEYVNELLGPGADGNDGTYHDLYSDDHNTKKVQVLQYLNMIHTHQYILKCELSIIIQVQVEMVVNYYAILARERWWMCNEEQNKAMTGFVIRVEPVL